MDKEQIVFFELGIDDDDGCVVPVLWNDGKKLCGAAQVDV